MLNLHVKIESGRLALNEAMHVKNYADWNSSMTLVSPSVLFSYHPSCFSSFFHFGWSCPMSFCVTRSKYFWLISLHSV